MRYDAYFFDMDQTLTRSKTEIEGEHFKLLTALSYKAPVVIVSGAVLVQMAKQIISRDVYYLAQNGNHAIDPSGEELWRLELTSHEIDRINAHIKQIAKAGHFKVDDETVQYRGCQVSFSLVGHDADLELKEAFDPSRAKRKSFLQKFPFEDKDLTVRIGGTTCLDYTRKDGTKGENVKRLINDMCFENPVYLGDALFPGGNDESVVGICDTIQVNSLEDTYDFISREINENKHGN